MHLITVGGLDIIVKATRKFKNVSKVDVCVEILRNDLKETDLLLDKKVFKPGSFAKNMKERLEFAKMLKDWIICDWKRAAFSDETKMNHLCFDGISWCWILNKKNLLTCAIK